MNANTLAVDVDKLKTVATETSSAKSVFKYLFDRRRGRQDTNIKRVQRILKESGAEVTTNDISDVFRKLQDLGIGKIIFGRKGNPNRFIWTANLRSLREIIEGKSEELFKQRPTAKKFNLPKLAVTTDKSSGNYSALQTPIAGSQQTRPHSTFIVRKGAIELEVPVNLTEEEAAGIVKLLSAAP